MSETVSETVVGIDLGTTNSEVAALVDGRVKVLGPGDGVLPSCIGLSPSGELLVGRPARNQLVLYPERTVKSIKRKMGANESVTLGDRTFAPQEISSLVLRELARWASDALGTPVKKAVVTVPAYFSDAQRQATREAGALAGLEVIRILNEPTAASLAYGHGDGKRRTVMIYDLGGGTFDVSIVTTENEVTEVLASHGDTQLGGDDFDALLVAHLERAFVAQHGMDLAQAPPLTRARLLWAAEEAKKKLSSEQHAKVREEGLATRDGVPLHLEVEVSRAEYEDMIRPLVERTLESVSRALADAGKMPGELDAILLVGGSTRTPLVARLLEERTGIVPRQEVHPDLCVALGAGVLASRLAGHAVERVLVDVTPYSFGPSYLGELNGRPYGHCYHPIIRRNTALPVTRTDRYFTAHDFQEGVKLEIFQGDDPDALRNLLVGTFRVEGLSQVEAGNEILCRMSLDVDGILHVTAVEKKTGLSKSIRIENALRSRTPAELDAARARLEELYGSRDDGSLEDDDDGYEVDADADDAEGWVQPFVDSVPVALARPVTAPHVSAATSTVVETERKARELLERSQRLLATMNPEDREDAIDLNDRIEAALTSGDEKALLGAQEELKELLFFLEGKR